MPSEDELPCSGPRIVEIVGPAGTGKTTLLRTMLRRYEDEVVGKPRLRRAPYLPLFATYAFALAPAILSDLLRRRFMSRERISKMLYLRVLAKVLQRGCPVTAKVRLLDQGPVYLLATLRDSGPPGVMHPRVAMWQEKSLEAWSSLLDAVVWLDAPDALLLERIDGRSKPHALKGSSGDETFEVLARSRRSCESVISELRGRRAELTVQRFDTSRESVDDIVSVVAATLGL